MSAIKEFYHDEINNGLRLDPEVEFGFEDFESIVEDFESIVEHHDEELYRSLSEGGIYKC